MSGVEGHYSTTMLAELKRLRPPPSPSPQGFPENSALGGEVGSLRLWLSVSCELVKKETEK